VTPLCSCVRGDLLWSWNCQLGWGFHEFSHFFHLNTAVRLCDICIAWHLSGMHPKVFETIRWSLAVGDGHCMFTVIILYIYIYIYIYVCIGYGRDEPGFESRKEQDFSVFQNIRSSSGVQSVDIQWVPGFFPGDKVNGSWSWLYLHLILRQRTGGAIHVLFL